LRYRGNRRQEWKREGCSNCKFVRHGPYYSLIEPPQTTWTIPERQPLTKVNTATGCYLHDFPSDAGAKSLKRYSYRLAAAVLAVFVAEAPAVAGDAGDGARIAQSRCAACHVVSPPGPQTIVAEAPSFGTIARQFDFNADLLTFHLLEPHPKMNFALTRREADDVAAYMSALPH
jgi:mono/diheme cytochrome c family protein